MKVLKKYKNTLSFIACVVSAIIQAFSIQVFMEPNNLLTGGVTGVALLINSLTRNTGLYIDTSLAIILINIPLALLCYKGISPRFTFFSSLNFILTSVFLNVFHFTPLFDDVILNIAFGGFLSAMSIVVALKGNLSTGGTDFVALYFSNKYRKSVWEYVFFFNIIIIAIFGYTTSWVSAGYSILFQFIATRTISSFHDRYELVRIEATTLTDPKPISDSYFEAVQHGMTVLKGYGGFSNKEVNVLVSVVSAYEVEDAIESIRKVDPNVIINVTSTQHFIGNFYQKPID